MKHIALRFGPANVLVGVVTQPTTRDRDTGVIILNAGVIHRAGPNRLYTDLAMRFASHGFTALRFDFSGIGDSDYAPRDVGLPNQNIHETQLAMDLMGENFGISRFILIGLCSGADNAFRVAAVDDRIVGLGLLDGYAYHTPISKRTRWRKTTKRMMSPSGLWRALTRAVSDVRFSRTTPRRAELGLMLKPSQADAEHDLLQLIDRGVQLLWVYTPELGVYNYADQFFDFFPSATAHENVRVEFFEHADHIFTRKQHQTELCDLMAAWIMEHAS